MKAWSPFLPFLLTVLVCSCSATVPTKKAPEKASANLEQEFRAAKSAVDAGELKKAVFRLKKIVQQSPESDLADDAHYLLGQIYFSAQQYSEALNHYVAIANSPVESPLETDSRLRAARILMKLSRLDDAEKMTERPSQRGDLSPEQSLELNRIRYELAVAKNQPLEALELLVVLSQSHPQPAERDKLRAQAQEILESRLSEDQIREVADESKFGFLRAPAKYRYALLMAEQRNYGKARDLFEEAAELAPGTELAERASTLIQQIDARNKVDARTIGVVLPLSGKQSVIGYKILHGIQLGLGIYGKAPSNFRLAVIDSEGNPDVARRAIERLVTEDNVIAIIGGLLSKTASAEATKAQELGVPTIMLTQKAGVTEAGDSVFRNALTSQMQVQQLVEVAMNKMGYKNFAIMYPNDPYGVEYTNLFWDEVKSHGGNITAVQPYDPKETDFRGHVERMVGTFYQEDRADEYRVRLRAWQEKNPRRSARQSAPSREEILGPIVDFDAVFIPDSVRALGQIAPMLAYNDVTKVRLLGPNLWNSPGLVQRGQKFVENSIFVDGFLNTDPKFQASPFYTSFKATFEDEPGLMEMQGYDSALILRQLIAGGESTRVGLQSRLASLQNFPGASGPLSVTADREIRRPLTTLTVKDGQIEEFETAQP